VGFREIFRCIREIGAHEENGRKKEQSSICQKRRKAESPGWRWGYYDEKETNKSRKGGGKKANTKRLYHLPSMRKVSKGKNQGYQGMTARREGGRVFFG